jgi:hypothetical protein
LVTKSHEQQCIDFGPALPAWAAFDQTRLKSRDLVLRIIVIIIIVIMFVAENTSVRRN